MSTFPYTLDQDDPDLSPMGLIVLETDETLEGDMRHVFAHDPTPLYVSRIASAPEVTPETLSAMADDLSAAARLLPKARPYRVVGYGCTSASSIIGSQEVARLVKRTCNVAEVTNPLRAAIACARSRNVRRLALLSPYIETVSAPLRAAFSQAGISTDVFGSFGEAEEAKVVRISNRSIIEAACALGDTAEVDGVFLSCTNLRTFAAIPEIERRLGKPVLSSNQALAWHMKALNKRT